VTGRVADPPDQVRSDHEQDEDEQHRSACEGEHRQRREPFADEASRLVPVVGDVEAPHHVLHRARERPDREEDADEQDRDAGTRFVRELRKAVLEQ
jgi:hypothetical protein